ncbi:O-antigen ligase domain-containing protein [Methylobacterium goesingense]|uniref:O-antigen ligase domain-containing protein n=1 Tax=Methylobacterium goesingense TaxID=243690 RepID=A0ABV2KZ16_9HYPH|nr:O-antigen ligase domain-containing protein [Methylobacterium goesingense]GJD73712.1 hypothetical protein CFIICLFH_1942 [Methylobacterium goesingense]
MRSSLAAAPAWHRLNLPGWLAAALLLGGTALAGPVLGGATRFAFIAGCAVVGWYAWRRSPASHLQAILLIFSFAPFLRRLVDLSAGYEASGVMLVGPLLAILMPLPSLRAAIEEDRPMPPTLAAVIVVGACVTYGTALSLFQGDWATAATGSLKWFAPLLYCAVLAFRSDAERREMVDAAASVFLAILPLTGLYGLYQYIDPPTWDRYWMQLTTIMSIGQPVPFGVRTFSTMNGPASFATFTAAGLLLVGFLRSGWITIVLATPAAFALLLSMYRTAWLSLALGVAFCLLFAATRGRAAGMMVVTVLAVAGASVTPFGGVIGERLASIGSGAQDDSARERLEQYVHLWNLPDSEIFGRGFTVTDVGSAGAMAIDGMIVSCWVTMGLVVGLCCLAGLLLAIGRAIDGARRDGGPEAVVVGALACGALVQMMLANIASGELGVLFWTFVVLAPVAGRAGR